MNNNNKNILIKDILLILNLLNNYHQKEEH